MSDVQTAVRKRIEGLSETDKCNILVVGTEPATFVNSMEMSVTGRWPNLGVSGGGVQDTTRCLNRFDMFPHIEGLSGKVACLGLSLEEKGDMSAAELEQTLRGVHTDVKIDMVVFTCPSNDHVPVDVLEGVKRGVDKTNRNVPIFLFMTKQSNRAPTKPMKENMQKAQKDLDIAAEDCRFIQLYQFQTQGSEVSQKTIDQPLLKFWDKILSVKDKDKQEDPKHSVKDQDKQEDLKHSPQWTRDLVDLGISRQFCYSKIR
ncbi:PREDICTED: uncharacterized protein LOC109479666 [Branchiostoma belcheri]|uniref:Uncharacterized protein LOC109479666 n=1 Tax=Branchiostoma belcheri TaxID=7741 RepID=A0A6P5A1Z5_BRABE|nr:PREDICTED: uncharacterized protein LOC109479666 [Branchiostoma belcheri]